MSVAFSTSEETTSYAIPELLEPISTLDDIDIRHIRYFLAVARCGSVSAAAAELNVSQPSLSHEGDAHLRYRGGKGPLDSAADRQACRTLP